MNKICFRIAMYAMSCFALSAQPKPPIPQLTSFSAFSRRPKWWVSQIAVAAALLIPLLVTFRLVEYQDAVRVSLTLKTTESSGHSYGEAYLHQSSHSYRNATSGSTFAARRAGK